MNGLMFWPRLPWIRQNSFIIYHILISSTTSLSTLMTFCKVNGTSMSPANCSRYNQSLSDLLHQWNAEEMTLSYAVHCQSSNMAIIERRLQGCLDKLVTCADENGFKFSPTKTSCVHFCKKNGLQPEPDLKLYGQQLPVEEQVKFLGLFFDKKLSFTPHIKYMKDKCRKALQLLRVISSKDWGGDRTTLLRIYRSHIRSKLDYGCIVYGSARRSYLAVLDPIANQGLRLCSGAFRTSPIESLQVETGEPSLETRRLKLSLQYYMKMKANPENPAYSCAAILVSL